MEQLTLVRPDRVAMAPLPAEAPLDMPRQSLSSYDRAARRRLRGETPVRLARLVLGLGAVALTAYLVHQMWLVLSVGGLTSVEWVMRVPDSTRHRRPTTVRPVSRTPGASTVSSPTCTSGST